MALDKRAWRCQKGHGTQEKALKGHGAAPCKNLYALNPSCIGEPCPTQPKQVKTIPTIEVGKEGLAAFTVWINVNGFPSTKKMNICTNEGPVGGMRPRDLRSM